MLHLLFTFFLTLVFLVFFFPPHRIVERSTGETLNRFFIRSIPFTYEAPGRQGGFDKFALITRDAELGQVECHILNVIKGSVLSGLGGLSFTPTHHALQYSLMV